MALCGEVYQEVLGTPSELAVHTHLIDLFTEHSNISFLYQISIIARYSFMSARESSNLKLLLGNLQSGFSVIQGGTQCHHTQSGVLTICLLS